MNINRFGILSIVSIVPALLTASLLLSGCNMTEIQCTWRDREVIINGMDEGSEWEGAKYFFEDKNVTIGLLNDDKYLYIRLSSRERSVQQNFMVQGFTLWFAPPGKQSKIYGIQFPIGIWGKMASIGSQIGSGQNADPAHLQKILDDSLKDLEILGPNNREFRTQLVARAGEIGIKLKMDVTGGNMVYELKMPLLRSASEPFGIGTEKTESISLGLFMGNIEAEQYKNRLVRNESDGMVGRNGNMIGSNNGSDAGGMDVPSQGLPGGASGGRVGMPGSGRSLENIDMWLNVHLAKE